MIKTFLILSAFLMVGILSGCSANPEVRSAEAQAVIDEQKAEIMKDYRACLKKYDKPEEHQICERYKKAIEAF